MAKYYITGIVASGKSTLARRLSKELGIPCYELDAIIHGEKGELAQRRTPDQQRALIREIDARGAWIIEGTFRESCRCLLDMADRIVFVDPPLALRRRRILTRFIKQQLRLEPCRYRSDLAMLRSMYRWTRDFERDRPRFEAMLAVYADKLIALRSDADVRGYAGQ